MQTAQTGDLLLFRGEGVVSSLLRFFGCSQYSHVGIFIKDPSFLHPNLKDGSYILHSAWGYSPDSEDNQYKFGVQIQPIEDVMALYSDHSVYIRNIKTVRDEAFYKRFVEAHKVIHGKPYDVHIMDWISAIENLSNPVPSNPIWKNTDRFWCSAMVSYVYYKLGWIKETNWSLIAPREYSKEGTGQVVFTVFVEEEEEAQYSKRPILLKLL